MYLKSCLFDWERKIYFGHTAQLLSCMAASSSYKTIDCPHTIYYAPRHVEQCDECDFCSFNFLTSSWDHSLSKHMPLKHRRRCRHKANPHKANVSNESLFRNFALGSVADSWPYDTIPEYPQLPCPVPL